MSRYQKPKQLVKQIREKAAIVPYVVSPTGEVHILLVYSHQFGEWSIITGGCKARENKEECGLREFSEETNRIFDGLKPRLRFKYFFDTGDLNEIHRRQNIARGFDVTYRYNVFFCRLPYEVFESASSSYSLKHKSGDENDKIAFHSYNIPHLRTLRMWDITQNELCSRHFKDHLTHELAQ